MKRITLGSLPADLRTGIGIDMGGTNIKAVVIDLRDGKVLRSVSRPTRDGEFDPAGVPLFAHAARELLHELIDETGEVPVGFSAPGIATKNFQQIYSMPNKMLGIEGFDWARFLGLRDRSGFVILNDAHAALLGEVWLGAARGCEDVVLLTLGTGVGGAILSNGELMLGRTGRAGHLGHLSLNPWGKPSVLGAPGTIEDEIGNHSVMARSGGRFPDTKSLVEAAEAGDSQAAAVWQRSVDCLGATLVGIINAFDPERIVLGGGVAKAGAALLDPLGVFLDRHEWRPGGAKVPVVLAELGENAGAFGAVRFAAARLAGL